jgi:hypothetical protein
MYSPVLGLRVASVVFGLVCLAQIGRLVARPEILVAGHLMPLWPSVVAVVVAGLLAAWMWQLAGRAHVGGAQ